MIIGVTGYIAAGKDTVAEYLIRKGFHHYSCSDELRAMLISKGLPNDREHQRALGNELREKFGPGYLAQRIIDKADLPAIITSIRTPGEVETLRKRSDFHLIFVDAPIKLRYERIISRKREGQEFLTFEEFKEQEEIEKQTKDKNKQQLTSVAKLADKIIINDGSLEDLFAKIDAIMKDFDE